MRNVLRGLAVVALVVGIAACGGDDDDPTIASDDESGAADAGAADITVTISGSQFDPTEIEADAGDVTIAIDNQDGFAHTFTSDDLGIDAQVDGGDAASVTASLEAGSYAFRCTIHPSMTGTITAS